MIALISSTLFIVMAVVLTENKMDKRLLLHGDQDLVSEFHRMSVLVDQLVKKNNETESELQNMKRHTTQLEITLQKMQTKLTSSGSYSSYIRWGRKTCPANGTELTYSGFVGGSLYTDNGGAGNHLCLSGDPLWDHYNDAVGANARIYGTEYELDGERSYSSAFLGPNLHDNDVPCAVCTTRRTTNIMIPGRNRCMAGWTEEYHGYLVAGHFSHPSATEYLCLDKQAEVILGGNQNSNGALLYMVEGICGSLKCPPYVNGRELTCVVCSK